MRANLLQAASVFFLFNQPSASHAFFKNVQSIKGLIFFKNHNENDMRNSTQFKMNPRDCEDAEVCKLPLKISQDAKEDLSAIKTSPNKIVVGEQLPILEIFYNIKYVGEKSLENWDGKELHRNIPKIILHVPAKAASHFALKPIVQAIEKQAFNAEDVLVISIVNLQDSLVGTRNIAINKTKEEAKQAPDKVVILDYDRTAQECWGLDNGKINLTILNAENTVLYNKSGHIKLEDLQIALQALIE